jgi:hypothetical protein
VGFYVSAQVHDESVCHVMRQKNLLVHQTTEDYCQSYQVKGHPVLEKIESLFAALVAELN